MDFFYSIWDILEFTPKIPEMQIVQWHGQLQILKLTQEGDIVISKAT